MAYLIPLCKKVTFRFYHNFSGGFRATCTLASSAFEKGCPMENTLAINSAISYGCKCRVFAMMLMTKVARWVTRCFLYKHCVLYFSVCFTKGEGGSKKDNPQCNNMATGGTCKSKSHCSLLRLMPPVLHYLSPPDVKGRENLLYGFQATASHSSVASSQWKWLDWLSSLETIHWTMTGLRTKGTIDLSGMDTHLSLARGFLSEP